MTSYHLTGIDNATMSNDRSRFDLRFRTDKGQITLTTSAEHLSTLISSLEKLEYTASLLDPASGLKPGEGAPVRAAIVDHHKTATTVMNGIPRVLLGLNSAQVFRWFALDHQRASAVQRDLEAEIPKLRREAGPH